MTNTFTDFRSTHLPYCLAKIGDTWIVLNRRYKPLGQMTRDHVEYDADPSRLVPFKGSFADQAIEKGFTEVEGRLYLYDDGTQPMESTENWARYTKLLHWLADQQIAF